ncbi:MAG: ABC transporter ATP-binding protein [Verrucomicrobiota bacterium]
MNYAITTHNLTKRFRRTNAVENLNLEIPEGSICALLGPNGAGKSTTLKMLVRLIRPSDGDAMVLGHSSRELTAKNFEEIGYVAEDQQLPLWMRVDQYFEYLKPFYPTWDDGFRQKLAEVLDLDTSRKLKHCSRGMRMKAALLGAVTFRPKLLILDEPFTGLDPLVREQVIQALVELTQSDGWTILISSHDMEEVERVADRIAFLNMSKLLLSEPTDKLLERFRKVEVTFSDPPQQLPIRNCPKDWLSFRQQDNLATFCDSKFDEGELQKRIPELLGAGKIESSRMSLREIFVAIAANHRTEKTG